MLGGLGRFRARFARVTRRCRRPKATGFTACLGRGDSLLGLPLPLGFGPPELRPLHASLVVLRGCHPASVCRLDGVAAARRRVLGQAGFQACARPQVLSVSPSLGVGRRVTRRCRRRRALGCCVACGRWCFFASFDRRVGPPRLNANRYTSP